MHVLLTGGSGTVGTAITDHLADDPDYSFTNLDVRGTDDPNVEDVTADARYYDEIRPHFEGVDAVVHLAYAKNYRKSRAEERVVWSHAHLGNLQANAAVFRGAIAADVDTVVYASSNHAVGAYEDRHAPALYDPDYDLTLDHTVQPAPDSMYGAMKVYGETLGRLAAEYHDTSVYAWRIARVDDPDRDTPADHAAAAIDAGTDPESESFRRDMARKQAMWFSRRDCAHMLACFLEDDTVDFDVFYGVSDNESRWFDIDHAREVVGYEPEDDGSSWDVP
ncbi:MAG: NAD-dependent epimerase/dehydratase family protein [Halorientalis sp.]